MVGLILQALTLLISLTTTYLLSRKGLEKWGYVVGFFGLSAWVVQEAYYQQWLYFVLNPIYFVLYFRGWMNHR